MESNFSFGSPDQTAQLYVDFASASHGPGLPDLHPDEMSHEDLVNQLVYIGIAITNAREDLQREVVNTLYEYFDRVFVQLAEVDNEYRDRLKTGVINLPRDGDKRNHGYYLKLAGLSAN